MAQDNRDSIDFGSMNVYKLFRKMFFPTLLGMLATSLMNVADGIFVGKGVGSDALAAINIAAPLFMVSTGIALMFGSGASVVASIHLSKDNVKAANINITQAFTVSLALMTVVVALVWLFTDETARLFGASERLLPYVEDYLYYVLPCFFFSILFCIGMYVIRLDGSPVYAMLCNVLPSVFNFILDYVFVFPMHMGIKGAGLATLLGTMMGGLMVVLYMFKFTNKIGLYKPKFSVTGIKLTLRNVGYMVKIGFSSMVSEFAVSCMMLVGNYVYMHYLGEDGVAAFSVACYTIPMVIMVATAVAASAQPIISYNYGLKQYSRIRQTMKVSLLVAGSFGLFLTIYCQFCSSSIVGLFIDNATNTYNIALYGYPFYSIAFFPLSLNIVFIGIYQSIESVKAAVFFTLLRGYIIIIPSAILLPAAIGIPGLWLSQPLSEIVTLASILVLTVWQWKTLFCQPESKTAEVMNN